MRLLYTLIICLITTNLFAQCDYPLSTALEIGTFNDCYSPIVGSTDTPIGAYAQPNCGAGPYTGNWYTVTTGLNGKVILDFENTGSGVIYASIFGVDGCFGSDDQVMCSPLPNSLYSDIQLFPLTQYVILIYSDVTGPSTYTLCVQEDPCGQGIPGFTGATNVSDHGLTVNWNVANPLPSGGKFILRYHEQGNSPNFSYKTSTNPAATSAYINGLEPDTRYIFRIGSKCIGQTVATFSDTFSIRTKKLPCPIPTGLSSIQNGNMVTLSWDDMGADSYKVRIFQSSNTYKNSSTNSVMVPFEAGLAYLWQVRSLCDNGTGSTYSGYDNYQYGFSGGGSSNPYMGEVDLYPNPAQNQLSVNWVSSGEEKLNIRILDPSGRTLQTLTEPVYEGFNKIDFELAETVTSGLYMVQLRSADQTKTSRLVVE